MKGKDKEEGEGRLRSIAPTWRRSLVSRLWSRQRPYLQGPGTGMTNFPSFSATKFSLLLLDELSPSFMLTSTTSFLVGFSGRHTFLPSGESCAPPAFCASSGVRFTRLMLEIL